MTTNKILFTIPAVKSMFGTEKGVPPHPHVGIAYLAAVLKQKKIKYAIFDDGINTDKNGLKNIINKENPTIIGITGFSYAYGYIYELINQIKKITKTPIIIGGPHAAAIGKDILNIAKIDFALIGESEESLPIFMQEFEKSKPDFSKVPGLIWKKKDEVIQNPQAPYNHKLDEIPFPDYESFQINKYPCYTERIIPILTSRGCPYGCNYCSVRLTMGRNFRPRSPQNVIKEIKYWYKKGYKSFDFNDDCFSLDINRAIQICDLILKNKLKIKFQLYNGIRVDRIDLTLLKKLKKAGCYFIAYGCESGSQKVLDIIQKNIKLEQVINAVKLTNKVKIHHAVNFIIGHQEETYQDALETLEFAKKLNCDYVNFYNLVPYPGTEVYNWALKNAKWLVSKETYLKDISYRDIDPIFETKEFTKEQKIKILKKGFNIYERKLFKFRFGKILGNILFTLTRINFISKIARNLVYKHEFFMKLFLKIVSKSKR